MASFDLTLFDAELGPHCQLGRPVIFQTSTASTNEDAKLGGREGLPHGSLLVADHQSAGRGRRGNVWAAPAGSCLLCSLVLRPQSAPESWPRWTHTLALAICHALEALGLQPQVKWPNDVYLGGRKVSGILLETELQSDAKGGCGFVVAGFGVNVGGQPSDFPPEVQDILTTVAANGPTVSRESLLARILQCLERLEAGTEQTETFQEILEELWNRSFLKNKPVTLLSADGTTHGGLAKGLDEAGGLLLENAHGRLHAYYQAEQVRLA